MPGLLLVGAGHAMLPLLRGARRLVQQGIPVTLLTDHPSLYYSGMVPEHLGGVYSAEEVQVDVVRLAAESGVAFVRGRAVGLDARTRTVTTASGARLHADVMAFDMGSVTPDRDRAPQAIPTKPLHRIEALARFAEAVLHGAGRSKRLMIVGGGAAGVETALNLSAYSMKRPGRLYIGLAEPADRLLPSFPVGAGAYAHRLLAQRGVGVRLGARVEEVVMGSVRLASGERLSADAVLWATGTAGPPLFRRSGLPVTEKGFLRVADTLQCEAAPWLFAAGDCASLRSHPHLSRVGVHAVKQGPVLRDNVLRAVEAELTGTPLFSVRLRPFRPYPVAPLILSTGEPQALIVAGSIWAHGSAYLRIKHLVDRRWMRRYPSAWSGPTWKMADLAAPL